MLLTLLCYVKLLAAQLALLLLCSSNSGKSTDLTGTSTTAKAEKKKATK